MAGFAYDLNPNELNLRYTKAATAMITRNAWASGFSPSRPTKDDIMAQGGTGSI